MHLNPKLVAMMKSERTAFALTIGLGSVAGICAVIFAWLMSRMINAAFLMGDRLTDLWTLLISMSIVAVVRALAQWGSENAASRLALNIKHNLRMQLLEHLFALGPAYTHGEHNEHDVRTGELTSSLTDGVEALDAYFSQYLPQIALSALVPLSIIIFVFPLDPLSAIVLLVTAPLIPIFMILIGSTAEAMSKRQWLNLSRMSAYILDVLQGLRTLKLLGIGRKQIQTIADVSEQLRRSTMDVLRVTFLSALVLELVTTISTAVVALQVGLRLLYGNLGFEEAFFVLLLAPEFYLPLRMLGTRFHAGMGGIAAAERILEILNIRPVNEVRGKVSINKGGEFPEDTGDDRLMKVGKIQFKDVSVHYSDGRVALEKINFEIKAGYKTALVGATGAGKSTIASLLLGFVKPELGEIWVDDIPLKDIPLDAWREIIAWVSQENYLFNDSVMANIRLGKSKATLEEVEHAARLANAHGFIQSLPNGYATRIGERGERLSAGQAQRIALARAFLKGAPILILDEPSAHLDSESESMIMDALDKLWGKRTAVVIAHRLNTICQSDQIILLNDGRIDAIGTHKELLTRSEIYQQLVLATGDSGEDHRLEDREARFSRAYSHMLTEPTIVHEHRIALPHSEKPYTTLKRLAGFLSPYRWRVVLSILLGWATILCGIGLMATSAFIITRAAQHPPIAVLQVAIVGVRFFGISRGFFRYLERLISHDLTLRILENMRLWLYKAIEPLVPARLSSYHSGDLLKRMTGDINLLESLYVRAVAPPLVAVLVVVTSASLLCGFNLGLGITYMVFVISGVIGLLWIILRVSQHAGKEIVRIQGELSVAIVDGLQGLPDLLGFGATKLYKNKVAEIQNKLTVVQKKLAIIGSTQVAALGLMSQFVTLTVLSMAIGLIGKGEVEGLYLGVIALIVLTSFEALQPLPNAAQVLASNLEAAGRLFSIADTPPVVTEPTSPRLLGERVDLEVRELRFSYPTNNDLTGGEALKSISFELPHGKHMAIVGPSGAGKSTLIRLLVRFWDAPSGAILLNGYGLSHYAGEELRKKVAVVPQSPYLFTATILDNLSIARSWEGMDKISMDEIRSAARMALIQDFIEELPLGYQTWVGEHGLRLSAGERQRIAIARTLLMNAPLLVLDEATANLDALTERAILHNLLQALQQNSLLIITHRIVGLEELDEILVLDRGRVVERGKHVELLELGGLYRHMWELQQSMHR